MPLKKGTSHKTIRENYLELRKAGFPSEQAWAAAYNQSKQSKPHAKQSKKGGTR